MLNNGMSDYKTYHLQVFSHFQDAYQILVIILVAECAELCRQSKE